MKLYENLVLVVFFGAEHDKHVILANKSSIHAIKSAPGGFGLVLTMFN